LPFVGRGQDFCKVEWGLDADEPTTTITGTDDRREGRKQHQRKKIKTNSSIRPEIGWSGRKENFQKKKKGEAKHTTDNKCRHFPSSRKVIMS
jgi:hypothetical protein